MDNNSSYTLEELNEKLESLNINREEFSLRELVAFTRQSKEYVDKFFVDYEADRLRLLGKMLTEFMEKGDKDA